MSILRSRVAAVVTVSAAVAGSVFVSAGPASADEVWFQSVGRVSADAPCPADRVEDLDAGWSRWGASWAEWMNNGRGGFTCDRSITWARSDPAASAIGCVEYSAGEYVSFGVEPWLPAGSDRWLDASCAGLPFDTNPNGVVYAPDGSSQATDLCIQYAPVGSWDSVRNEGANVWSCLLAP